MKKSECSYLRRVLLNVLNGHDIFRSGIPFILRCLFTQLEKHNVKRVNVISGF